jgi:hypothetical protein
VRCPGCAAKTGLPRRIDGRACGIARASSAATRACRAEGVPTGTQTNSKRAHQPHLPQQGAPGEVPPAVRERRKRSEGSLTPGTTGHGDMPVRNRCTPVVSLTRVLKQRMRRYRHPGEERHRGRLPGPRGANPEGIRTVDWLRAPVQRGGLAAGHGGIGKPVRPCARHHGRGHPRGSA